MTQQFDIPNNLSQAEIDMEFENAVKLWKKFVSPNTGDILVLNGSHGPYKFVFYINSWHKF